MAGNILSSPNTPSKLKTYTFVLKFVGHLILISAWFDTAYSKTLKKTKIKHSRHWENEELFSICFCIGFA